MYVVRELGGPNWAEGIRTLADAVYRRDHARQTGLSKATIIANTPSGTDQIGDADADYLLDRGFASSESWMVAAAVRIFALCRERHEGCKPRE